MTVRIRPIRPEDAGPYLNLCLSLDSETEFLMLEPGERSTDVEQQREKIERVLQAGNRMIFVAETDEGELVGALGADGGEFRRNRHVVSIWIGVLQAYAGQGIGRRLFEAVEAWAREWGARRLELTVMRHNQVAQALYKKMGFQIEGARRDSLWVNQRYIDEYVLYKIIKPEQKRNSMPVLNSLSAIKEIFAFAFRDPNWKIKFLIGSAITLAGFVIPILPWLLVLGYGARVARMAAQGNQPAGESSGDEASSAPVGPATLPEWDHWEDLLMDGLRQFGVSFFITLPMTLVYLFGFTVYTISILGISASGGGSSQVLFGMFFAIALVIFIGCMILGTVLMPLTYLVYPATAAHVAVEKKFGALLSFSEWYGVLRRNIGEYLAMLFCLAGIYAVMMLAFYILSFVSFMCCLFNLFTMPLLFFINILFFYMSGLAYRGMQAAVEVE